MKKRTKLLALALAGALSLSAFSGCCYLFDGLFYEDSKVEIELTQEAKLSSAYDEENGHYDVYVEGLLKNPSEEEVSMSIGVTLYDTEGNVIGTAYDYISNVQSGETWRFCAVAETLFEPASFRITEMEGYSY